MFDERNADGNNEAIHNALQNARPEESPLFRKISQLQPVFDNLLIPATATPAR